jgi:transglutaminase-like putative cysteine protease
MTGGGIINRKTISILLLLLTLALPLNVGAISAATTSQTTNINQNFNQSLSNNTEQSLPLNKTKTIEIQNSTTNTSQNHAAAGTVNTVSATPVYVSLDKINAAASRVQTFIQTYHRLPSSVLVSGQQVSMSTFLYLLTFDLMKVNSGSKTPIALRTIKSPSFNGTETLKTGKISKTEYVSIAKRINTYINKYWAAPRTAFSSLGNFRYETLVYTYSKILGFYGTNKRLPNYVSTQPGIAVPKPNVEDPPLPTELLQYLDPTKNCQADDPTLKALATSITQGYTSTLDKATAIFNWVRNNISYSFYYDTQKGALGTYNARTANCVDTAHLMIALERAAGIPAKYEHVYAQFSSGTWYGHVIALVYVNGVWYKADGTSSRNLFGVVNNWNTNTATVKGIYRELPF